MFSNKIEIVTLVEGVKKSITTIKYYPNTSHTMRMKLGEKEALRIAREGLVIYDDLCLIVYPPNKIKQVSVFSLPLSKRY